MAPQRHKQVDGARQPPLTGKKSLGQNFLVDQKAIDRIVGEFAPHQDDVVLEIGPGHGALTGGIVGRVGRLVALEFDRMLAARLRARFGERPDFTVIEEDALSFDFRSVVPHEGVQIRLIANLPYNISTAILQRLFDVHGTFSDCVLMFQREVVERITAKPGTKDRGYLTVLTEAYFESERLFDVPPSAFQPAPKIWSSVVRLTSKSTPPVSKGFSQLVAASFAQKRKTIANNLKIAFPNSLQALVDSDIDPRRRAETLTLEEWLRLSEAIQSGD